jgi:hypothetical protein
MLRKRGKTRRTGSESPPSADVLSLFGNIDHGRRFMEAPAGIPTLRAFQLQQLYRPPPTN